MPVGLIGSGKTTVVKLLAEHFGLVRVSTDEIREGLARRGYSFEGAREISHELGVKYLKLGYSIAVDANVGSKNGLAYNEKTRETFPQVRQICIYTNPPEDFIINHLKIRHKPLIFKDAEHAIERFHFHKKQFTLPDFPFVCTFDPSRNDFPEQIKQCIKAIENNLRAM